MAAVWEGGRRSGRTPPSPGHHLHCPWPPSFSFGSTSHGSPGCVGGWGHRIQSLTHTTSHIMHIPHTSHPSLLHIHTSLLHIPHITPLTAHSSHHNPHYCTFLTSHCSYLESHTSLQYILHITPHYCTSLTSHTSLLYIPHITPLTTTHPSNHTHLTTAHPHTQWTSRMVNYGLTHTGGEILSLSKPLRNECCKASLADTRLKGSRVNIRSMRSRANSGI